MIDKEIYRYHLAGVTALQDAINAFRECLYCKVRGTDGVLAAPACATCTIHDKRPQRTSNPALTKLIVKHAYQQIDTLLRGGEARESRAPHERETGGASPPPAITPPTIIPVVMSGAPTTGRHGGEVVGVITQQLKKEDEQ